MMKTRSSRPVFLSAAILMILLGTVLIGSTFASNVDYSGNADPVDTAYDVDFEYHNGNDYVPMKDVKVLTKDMLWCPGKTEIIYIRLENHEQFLTNCTLTLNVKNSGFADTLTYAIIDKDLKSDDNPPKNWKKFLELARTDKETGEKEWVLSEGPHVLLDKKALDPTLNSTKCYLALAIHMDENTSNIYEDRTMEFDLVLQIDSNEAPTP